LSAEHQEAVTITLCGIISVTKFEVFRVVVVLLFKNVISDQFKLVFKDYFVDQNLCEFFFSFNLIFACNDGKVLLISRYFKGHDLNLVSSLGYEKWQSGLVEFGKTQGAKRINIIIITYQVTSLSFDVLCTN
jgi:hypothetical protein